jgi:hypothetical protein
MKKLLFVMPLFLLMGYTPKHSLQTKSSFLNNEEKLSEDSKFISLVKEIAFLNNRLNEVNDKILTAKIINKKASALDWNSFYKKMKLDKGDAQKKLKSIFNTLNELKNKYDYLKTRSLAENNFLQAIVELENERDDIKILKNMPPNCFAILTATLAICSSVYAATYDEIWYWACYLGAFDYYLICTLPE